jgi:hypothetical protein
MANRTTDVLASLLAAGVGRRDDRAELELRDCTVAGLLARCGTLPVYEDAAA